MDPLKKRVFGLFFVFGFDSALKTIDELLKSLKPPKQSKWLFWWLKAFFSAFSKIPTKRSFVCLLFLKLNQSRNMKKQFFGGFSSKTKNALFRVPKFGFGLLKSYMTHTVHCTVQIHTIHAKYILMGCPWMVGGLFYCIQMLYSIVHL